MPKECVLRMDGVGTYIFHSKYTYKYIGHWTVDADKVAASPLMYIVQLHRIHKSFKTPITKAEIQ